MHRKFHQYKPEHLFVFHIKNDVPDDKRGFTKVFGSKALTVAIVIDRGETFYGLCHCAPDIEFNGKLAANVAIGRLKKRLGQGIVRNMSPIESGRLPGCAFVGTPKEAAICATRDVLDRFNSIQFNEAMKIAQKRAEISAEKWTDKINQMQSQYNEISGTA